MVALIPTAVLLIASFTFLIARPISQVSNSIRALGEGQFAKPIRIEEFEAEKKWWGKPGQASKRKENEFAWRVSLADIATRGYNLDVKNPHTVDDAHPCGAEIGVRAGVVITAERSVGYFQLNACNFVGWEWQRFYNARHNAGTAHDLWSRRGWQPWYFSARALGLL